MRGIDRSPVDSPHKGPVTRKMFSFDDVIMGRTYNLRNAISFTIKLVSLFETAPTSVVKNLNGTRVERASGCEITCLDVCIASKFDKRMDSGSANMYVKSQSVANL